MTRETAQKHREAYNAFADGKEIQQQGSDGNWYSCSGPAWGAESDYRIKPREPREFDAVINHIGELVHDSYAKPNPDWERVRVREILPDETP